MKVRGKDIVLTIDQTGISVAGAKSCELNVDQDFIQVSSPVSGRWRKYIPSTIGWTASIDKLVVAMDDPQAWLGEMKRSAQPLTMRYYDTKGGPTAIQTKGKCWISSWQNGAQVGSLATFSVQLQGTEELKHVIPAHDVDMMDEFDVYTEDAQVPFNNYMEDGQRVFELSLGSRSCNLTIGDEEGIHLNAASGKGSRVWTPINETGMVVLDGTTLSGNSTELSCEMSEDSEYWNRPIRIDYSYVYRHLAQNVYVIVFKFTLATHIEEVEVDV